MNTFASIPMPDGLSREELIEILLHEEYGYLPTGERSFSVETVTSDERFCASKATFSKLNFTMRGEWGTYTFPLYEVIPKKKAPVPAFLHINFRDLVPDKYQPTEELVDAGYAIFTVFYKDVTSDDGDFTNGLAGAMYKDGERGEYDAGKIAMWAFAAMHVMDYIQTRSEIDHEHVSVAGHSRLGKTALLTGALDGRFYCAFSNDSGCSGAAISRNKKGESIADICQRFPFWFSKHYTRYAHHEEDQPFDQHFLLAANAPHRVYVASALEDEWADPEKEFLACLLTSPYYEALGLSGFVCEDSSAVLGQRYHEGYIGYHMRPGTHYFSREDWLCYVAYLDAQK